MDIDWAESIWAKASWGEKDHIQVDFGSYQSIQYFIFFVQELCANQNTIKDHRAGNEVVLCCYLVNPISAVFQSLITWLRWTNTQIHNEKLGAVRILTPLITKKIIKLLRCHSCQCWKKKKRRKGMICISCTPYFSCMVHSKMYRIIKESGKRNYVNTWSRRDDEKKLATSLTSFCHSDLHLTKVTKARRLSARRQSKKRHSFFFHFSPVEFISRLGLCFPVSH